MSISWIVPFGIGVAASQQLGTAWFRVALAAGTAFAFALPMSA